MLTRPTPQTVGLTEEHLEALRTAESRRDHLLHLISSRGTVILGICFAAWVLLPLQTENLLARLALVGFLLLIGWVFIEGILNAVTRLFLRKPDQYSKVEAYDKAIANFRNDWREHYWKSFWDSVSLLSYHVEPENDFPKARLGFIDNLHIPYVLYFCVLNGKRHAIYTVPQDSPFDRRAAQKAVFALTDYHADVMCLISPNGFLQNAIEYLAKDHPKQFLFQIGQEAIETVNSLKTLKPNGPAIPLDVVTKADDFLKSLQEWQTKRGQGSSEVS